MLTYKKDDFDESIEDIMKTVDEIINKNNKNKEKDDEELEKNGKKQYNIN